MFDQFGKFLRKFGAEGSKEWHFSEIEGIAFDRAGNVLVADSKNAVQVFRPDGTFVTAFTGDAEAGVLIEGAYGLCVDSQGRILIAGRLQVQVYAFCA